MLQVLQLLRVTDAAGVQEFTVLARTLPDQVHIGIGSALLGLEVGDDGVRSDDLLAEAIEAFIDRSELTPLGEIRRLVIELREPGIALLDLKERELRGWISLHRRSSLWPSRDL
jgi:hypothetical protein